MCKYNIFMYTFSTGEAPDRAACPLFAHTYTEVEKPQGTEQTATPAVRYGQYDLHRETGGAELD